MRFFRSGTCEHGRGNRLRRTFSVNHRRVSDSLDELGSCPAADIGDDRFAVLAVTGSDAQLHELVSGERDVDLGQHRFAQAARANDHHRIQMMCLGAQGALLFAR